MHRTKPESYMYKYVRLSMNAYWDAYTLDTCHNVEHSMRPRKGLSTGYKVGWFG